MVRHRCLTLVASSALVAVTAACSGTPFGVLSVSPDAAPESQSFDAGAAPSAPEAAAPIDPAEGGHEAEANAPVDAGAAAADAFADADADAPAPVHASCAVVFTVTGAFVDGIMLRGVSVGGDAPTLGGWNPSSAPALQPVAPGVWSGALVLEEGQHVEFRFLETGPTEIIWEGWGAGSNRSLTVACGAADGAVPTHYVGQFDVKPPDAT